MPRPGLSHQINEIQPRSKHETSHLTSSLDSILAHPHLPKMLHSQTDGVDDAYLVNLDDLEIRLLERCRVRLVGKASALANASDGQHVIDSAAQDLDGLFEGRSVRVPVADVALRRPYQLASG